MAFSVTLTRFTQYFQLAVSGPSTLKNFVELVDTMGRETALWSDRRVLVDLRAVDGELAPPEQVFLGELVAQDLPHLERLASIVPAARLTHNSESAAQGLGMKLRVFTSKDDAVAWVTAQPAPDGAHGLQAPQTQAGS
jgi:hypothetical protein